VSISRRYTRLSSFRAWKMLDQGLRIGADLDAPTPATVPIAHTLVEAAPDRVLWGTDFPHPNATHEADEADLVDLVPQFAPDPLAQKRLLVDNPARLYGFGS
jgi:predicted TIM-barrel fold metal-dependent hydrolase